MKVTAEAITLLLSVLLRSSVAKLTRTAENFSQSGCVMRYFTCSEGILVDM